MAIKSSSTANTDKINADTVDSADACSLMKQTDLKWVKETVSERNRSYTETKQQMVALEAATEEPLRLYRTRTSAEIQALHGQSCMESVETRVAELAGRLSLPRLHRIHQVRMRVAARYSRINAGHEASWPAGSSYI